MFLRILWCLIPIIMFLCTLWSYLESIHKNHWKQESKNLFKASLFTLAITLTCIVVDLVLVEGFDFMFFEDILYPKGGDHVKAIVRILLYPVLAVFGAKIAGPSKQIRIKSAPKLNRYKPH